MPRRLVQFFGPTATGSAVFVGADAFHPQATPEWSIA
jgi:hypothetical protein